MAWVIRLALQDWVELSILFSDSTIALCWLTSEKLRLSLFHRNRVVQIRRGTELDNVYHVRTEYNPADCGTRPCKVTVADLGPGSRWECGDSWMKLELDEAVKEGYIRREFILVVSIVSCEGIGIHLNMPRKCMAPSCTGNKRGEPYSKLVSFPKDAEERNRWIEAMPNERDTFF